MEVTGYSPGDRCPACRCVAEYFIYESPFPEPDDKPIGCDECCEESNEDD